MAPANPFVRNSGSVLIRESQSDADYFLDDVISLDDYMYLVGMSEEYHCFYPATLDSMRSIKQALLDALPEALLPSGRLDSVRLLNAFDQSPHQWRRLLDSATIDILRSSQHFALPFYGKGIVEQAIDHAYSSLIKHKTAHDFDWLRRRIEESAGVFEKMVLQQAFYETPILPLQYRETLMLCAGLHHQLQRQSGSDGDQQKAHAIAELHETIGFHAERYLSDTGADRRHPVYSGPSLTSEPERMAALEDLEKLALGSLKDISNADILALKAISQDLISMPSKSGSIQALQQALAYRLANCLSMPTSSSCTAYGQYLPDDAVHTSTSCPLQ